MVSSGYSKSLPVADGRQGFGIEEESTYLLLNLVPAKSELQPIDVHR